MRILVIGGSYFFGRWFVQLAHKEHEITVLNRGNITVGLEGVTELKADRRDEGQLSALSLESVKFDAVVDFCAYNRGDIAGILRFLDTDALSVYIFISTVDVYRRGSEAPSSELTPFEDRRAEGDEGAYIEGKIALEHELVKECRNYGIKPVSIRPAVLYGPGNYAPRENMYFEWIAGAGQIMHPLGAAGHWQMIYVKDAAGALKVLLEKPVEEIKEAYNFCTGEPVDYDLFEASLKEAYRLIGNENGYEVINVAVEDVVSQGIPLPFPLFEDESETYTHERYDELAVDQTSLSEGLCNCLKVYSFNGRA
ncbi:MAG: NAD-dependent epimerase/dehydratase family protein [Lachnospiraceae bacterium]|nr:NAD-dependent epimerase/dehydratase family protein [Lachnospiraceae bacterium]